MGRHRAEPLAQDLVQEGARVVVQTGAVGHLISGFVWFVRVWTRGTQEACRKLTRGPQREVLILPLGPWIRKQILPLNNFKSLIIDYDVLVNTTLFKDDG